MRRACVRLCTHVFACEERSQHSRHFVRTSRFLLSSRSCRRARLSPATAFEVRTFRNSNEDPDSAANRPMPKSCGSFTAIAGEQNGRGGGGCCGVLHLDSGQEVEGQALVLHSMLLQDLPPIPQPRHRRHPVLRKARTQRAGSGKPPPHHYHGPIRWPYRLATATTKSFVLLCTVWVRLRPHPPAGLSAHLLQPLAHALHLHGSIVHAATIDYHQLQMARNHLLQPLAHALHRETLVVQVAGAADVPGGRNERRGLSCYGDGGSARQKGGALEPHGVPRNAPGQPGPEPAGTECRAQSQLSAFLHSHARQWRLQSGILSSIHTIKWHTAKWPAAT